MTDTHIQDILTRTNENMPVLASIFSKLLKINPQLETQPIIVQQKENKVIKTLPKENKRFSDKIKIRLLCNWTTSEELCRLWGKMKPLGSRIHFSQENPDFYIIINAHGNPDNYVKNKTIVFHMEPKQFPGFGEGDGFLKVFSHKISPNVAEWHLARSYSELQCEVPKKKYDREISTVLSGKYMDPGHILRVDFVKELEKSVCTHVFGSNRWDYKEYKGSLPYHNKDLALFPYKYTFNCENHSLSNYYTEKLVDGILAECLVFYHGCPNIREIIDPRAYVELPLISFKNDIETVKKAIAEDWHTQRLPYIREAKRYILDHLQFFPRVEREIGALRDK